MYTFMGLDNGEREAVQAALALLGQQPDLTDDMTATVHTLRDYLKRPLPARLVALQKENGALQFFASNPDLARVPIVTANESYTESSEMFAADDEDRVAQITEAVKVIRERKRLQAAHVATQGWVREVEQRNASTLSFEECEELLRSLWQIVRELVGEYSETAEA